MRASDVSSFSPSMTSATCDEVDRAAALLRDDDASELRGLAELAFDAHDGIALPARDAPRRHVLVRGAHRAHHLVDADAQRGQRVGLDADQHLPRDAAVDVDLRDAGQALERLDDRLVGERGQLAQPDRRREHGERDHRLLVLVVGADDQRILDVARKARAHDRDLVAHVLHRARDVGVEPELGEHRRDAFVRVAADQLDAGDLVQRVLERLGDVGLHRFGRRARVVREHEHERQRDLRHLLDLEPLVAEHAQHGDRDHHHRREDRVARWRCGSSTYEFR